MPGARGKKLKQRGAYWTRDRIILGLKRFHQDFDFCPTSSEAYAKHAQFRPRGSYPSFATILDKFPSFRQAWRAAGFVMNHSLEEWSPTEDWFVLETVGILPRDEVANYLGRTPASVKRRLYDLGPVRANNRWGITVSRAAELMLVPQAIFRTYIKHGKLPVYYGHKLIYLNPADLPVVTEADWSNANPYLEDLIRRAIVQRICKILTYGKGWRDREIYKFDRDETLFTKRIKRRDNMTASHPPEPRTDDLKVGDWVRTIVPMEIDVEMKRVGLLKSIYWSPLPRDRKDGTYRRCWMARVEYPKLHRSPGNRSDKRLAYTIPLGTIKRAERPVIVMPELSMHPEAIRGRERFAGHVARARESFKTIQGDLT